MPMISKIDRMVTYLERLLPIKPHDQIIRWSWKIRKQTKIVLCQLQRDIMSIAGTV